MKNTKVLKHMFFFGFFLVSGYAFGQENLEQWMKECDRDKTVDITVIDNKFPDTRKPDCYVIKITLKNKAQLQELMYKAYEKDKANAYSAIVKRFNGVIVPERCEFNKTEADQTVTQMTFDFYYDAKKEETVVTMIKTFDSTNPNLKYKRNRRYEGG